MINKHQKISSFQISFNYFTSFFGESDGKKKKKGLTEMGKSPTVVLAAGPIGTRGRGVNIPDELTLLAFVVAVHAA